MKQKGIGGFHVRVALAVAATLLGLVLCELAVRVYNAADEARKLAAWASVEATHYRPGAGRAKIAHLIRPSGERRIVYELIPGLSLDFIGVPVTTNAHGFRGPALTPEPRPGTLRILGIGDSVMFGWGVSEESCFLRVLEARLAAGRPELAVEVINLAVPGYNTVMEVETLEVKGLALQPDVVVIDHVGNDLSLPNFLVRHTDHWTLSRSFALELLRDRFGAAGRRPVSPFEPAPRQDRYQFESDPERVPPEYRDLVGPVAFRTAMRRLAELGDSHGFRVVVTSHMAAPEYLVAICTELDLPLVEVNPRLRRIMREQGIEVYRGSVLTLSNADSHPSVLGHRVHAEELERRLVSDGLLDRAPGEER